ncbi:hypothetical protein ABID22_000775 [Pontibacter aydingkolensis]|uniref:SpoIIAA-like n=1 Tax=Pontibacter aydingkolensis TaxID=1911536 RepID=A0ABS7CR99_9BACT|nr:hypothetical protein [Pontibacter aydingkolensis]MBW7466355.1 hypothetical protein [Pontibacter aydingkolensis]
MILYDNSILKLDYDPATDILEVAYPDLHDFLLVEIKYSIDQLIENVNNYDVKRLLLDSSRTVIAVNGERSREITSYLAASLCKTRLQKLARLQSPDSTVEVTAQSNIKHIETHLHLPFVLRNFTSRKEACGWLTTN